MTENIEVLNEKHQALERRHSEVSKENDLRYNTILSTLSEIRETLHGIDKSLSLNQRDLQSANSDIESGKRRIGELSKEVVDISSSVLKLRSKCDALGKRDPVTLWTSIGAAVTAVGAFVAIILSAFHSGKP